METIRTRKSIRNYSGEKIKEDDKKDLLNYLNDPKHLMGPFGNSIQLIFKELHEVNENEKIGTYGFIKNAPAFLISVCKNDQASLLDLGFVLEKLILYLEEKGLSTCWLGGTFHRKKLQLEQAISEEAFIPIIVPVGYASEKAGVFAKLIRKMAKSDHRADFDLLFFHNDLQNPIKDQALRELLEYVRLAPSASNKQPWRLVMADGGVAHFFIERTPKYGSSLVYDIQMVDMGIALAHYSLVSGKEEVHMENPGLELPNENYSYLFSVFSKALF